MEPPGRAKQSSKARAEVFGVESLAFPDSQDLPSAGLKLPLDARIALHILLEFPRPEFDARFRRVSEPAIRMSVPKTAVHKNGDTMPGKDDVRSAGQVLAVEAEAVSEPVQHSANGQLRSCVALTDPRHHGASFWI